MKLEYFYQTGITEATIDGISEYIGDEGYTFEYEPAWDDIRDALADIIYDLFFKNDGDTVQVIIDKKEGIKELYEEDCIVEERFYDDLKEYFMQEAYEAFEEGNVEASYYG